MDQDDNKIYFSDDGHLNDGGISLYVDGMILDKVKYLPKSVLQHVDGCIECKMKITHHYGILKDEVNIRSNQHPYFSRFEEKNNEVSIPAKPRAYFILKIAATVLLLLSSIFVVQLFMKRNVNEQVVDDISRVLVDTFTNIESTAASNIAPKKDTISQKRQFKSAGRKYIAENFTEYPVFEGAIYEVTRSEGSVEIISPQVGDTIALDQYVKFEWKYNSDKNFTVAIIDNMGQDVINKSLIDKQHYQHKTRLTAGLYYWKLILESEVIYIGKFVVY